MNIYVAISATIALALSIFSFPLLNNFSTTTNLEADLVVTNGVIFTGDDSLLFADSMAIKNGRIVSVGNYSAVHQLAADGTNVLNLQGKVVVPGFIDSHVHFIPGGLQAASHFMEVDTVVQIYADSKKGSWILGGGWNNDLWGGDLPMASWIDDITPHNPVWLSRMDGHMGLANSVALQLVGITNLSEDPNGGTIMRTSSGEPTGLLIDAAMKLILPWIPEVSVDERREALLRASNLALSRGVTTVVDFGRYYPGESVQLSWEDFAGHVLSDWVYLGGVKAFADGSLGSNSALFHEPYADEPHNYGLQVMELESLLSMTMASDKSGLQVAIHAIGDRANDLVLDMYKSVVVTTGKRDQRFRIEHAQHLASGTAARFGDQGIVASMQPQHLLDDADSARKKLGVDRAERESYLFQSLLANNALLALGSDWPVADINPLCAIRTAMKRIPPGWDNAWIPSERISLTDALIAHTLSAARACFLENDVGSLSPGKIADFVILSTSSWEDFAAEVSASIEATYVSGVQAYP
ncbi:protein LONG AFTER FAR-RED 3 [Citrus sinensis]|uniref:Protein LONG AFTER FAR-RED 3 n=1 Tax=Citrus sinensis TaxID=2711 RepID=A0ACB8IN86_CITSI|nr:protein LONG AFTER FAR-RED 3 [Citrus sinensis]